MTDHKFTDDDVIKALECLSGEEIFCKDCAFAHLEDHGFACKKNVANAALALINRQKVEIESLKIANEKMYSANKEQEAEIESLNAIHADMTESLRLAAEANKDMQAEIKRLYIALEENQKATKYWKDIAHRETGYVKTARAEAIKELAERLKKRLERKYTIYGREYVLRHLRELVKEMTEEQK